ncbi:hypothetical protein BDF19DRAFT_496967 [Syncephalis fuscata]|nr:hypothetical protein BDF19DRAFT_496967 [Syncephalis fuscata]
MSILSKQRLRYSSLLSLRLLPSEILWYILLFARDVATVNALMRTSKYFRDVCQGNSSFWTHEYYQRYPLDNVEDMLIAWLRYWIIREYGNNEPQSGTPCTHAHKHAYLLYMLRNKIGRRWRTGSPLFLSIPASEMPEPILDREEYWKICAVAVWGGIWWSGRQGKACMAILSTDPLQRTLMYNLVLPPDVQLHYRFRPIFLAGRRHVVAMTPSNASQSRVVSWLIDNFGSAPHVWQLRDVSNTPIIQDSWLACISAEQPDINIKLWLLPNATSDASVVKNTIATSNVSRAVLTLIDLNRKDQRIYQFIDVNNMAYHFHGMYNQSAIVFTHQLDGPGNALRWQLGLIGMSELDVVQSTCQWRCKSKGYIELASSISRYLFTSTRLDDTRVLLQGSNLFGTKGCLAIIDVTANTLACDKDKKTGFVWLNNYLYSIVVPLLSVNKLVACPPASDAATQSDENTAAVILDLNNGNILMAITGASWLQVEPIFSSLIVIGMTDAYGLSTCYAFDVNSVLTTLPPPKKIPAVPKRSSTMYQQQNRLSASRLSSSTVQHSLDSFKVRDVQSLVNTNVSMTNGHLLLKFNYFGEWHASPTALMSSFCRKPSNGTNFTTINPIDNAAGNNISTNNPIETDGSFNALSLYHFAYSLFKTTNI